MRLSALRCRIGGRALAALLLLMLLAGCAGGRAEVRGRPPAGPVTTVARLASVPANGTVTVRGTMVEK